MLKHHEVAGEDLDFRHGPNAHLFARLLEAFDGFGAGQPDQPFWS